MIEALTLIKVGWASAVFRWDGWTYAQHPVQLTVFGIFNLEIPFDKAAAVLLYPWPARYV